MNGRCDSVVGQLRNGAGRKLQGRPCAMQDERHRAALGVNDLLPSQRGLCSWARRIGSVCKRGDRLCTTQLAGCHRDIPRAPTAIVRVRVCHDARRNARAYHCLWCL